MEMAGASVNAQQILVLKTCLRIGNCFFTCQTVVKGELLQHESMPEHKLVSTCWSTRPCSSCCICVLRDLQFPACQSATSPLLLVIVSHYVCFLSQLCLHRFVAFIRWPLMCDEQEQHANAFICAAQGWTPLHHTAAVGNSEDYMQMLLSHGAHVNATDLKVSCTLLICFASEPRFLLSAPA